MSFQCTNCNKVYKQKKSLINHLNGYNQCSFERQEYKIIELENQLKELQEKKTTINVVFNDSSHSDFDLFCKRVYNKLREILPYKNAYTRMV